MSPGDLSEQLEVVFDEGAALYRNTSLCLSTERPSAPPPKTSCFVHGLFGENRLRPPSKTGTTGTSQLQRPSESKEEEGRGGRGEQEREEVSSNDGGTKDIDAASSTRDAQSFQTAEGIDGAASSSQNTQPVGAAERAKPDTSSRLLTKKQLSDMAFSIRELSKKLGRYRLRLDIRNVFLLTKVHDSSLVGHTRSLAEWLLSSDSGGYYTVYVEETLKSNRKFDTQGLVASDPSYKGRLKFWTTSLCAKEPHLFDIVIALGGDGTVLYASWLFQTVVPPVLSFSLGSLGFLTKFDFGDYRGTLRDAFDRGMSVSLRLRLEATVMRSKWGLRQKQRREKRLAEKSAEDGHLSDDEVAVEEEEEEEDPPPDLVHELIEGKNTHYPEQTRDILNEVVLDRGPNPTMSSLELLGDTHHLTTILADGLCVSTPTGSTAYNLSAGGSLCHPDNPVILITAICAHTLSFRPIILPDTTILRLGVPYDARNESGGWVSFDGRGRTELRRGDFVTVVAGRYPFPTVLPVGRDAGLGGEDGDFDGEDEDGGEAVREDWIDSLSRTLNWNERKRQKAFK
ncbi:MAG: hypothetical protein M1831_004285 [Alyxoria varia]|nr:MAG: hypothetical protein M1831_004285 [Alyxoria varia]